MDFSYKEYANSEIKIQKIVLNNIDKNCSTNGYFSELHSLIKIFCFNYGFEPGVDVNMLRAQILSFISKAVGKIICVIIDDHGLFLKDSLSADKYIHNTLESSDNKVYPSFGN